MDFRRRVTVQWFSTELDSGAASACQVRSECDYEQHQEKEKQELRYAGCGKSYTGKAKDCSNNRNQQERQRPIDHRCLRFKLKAVASTASQHRGQHGP